MMAPEGPLPAPAPPRHAGPYAGRALKLAEAVEDRKETERESERWPSVLSQLQETLRKHDSDASATVSSFGVTLRPRGILPPFAFNLMILFVGALMKRTAFGHTQATAKSSPAQGQRLTRRKDKRELLDQ